jgi:hypothetical protein
MSIRSITREKPRPHEVIKGQMLRKLYENVEAKPLPTGFPKRVRDKLIQVLLGTRASIDQTIDATQTLGQVLDSVLEEQEKPIQENETQRAR